MRDVDLFQLALGLVPPWMVKAANFDADKKRLLKTEELIEKLTKNLESLTGW